MKQGKSATTAVDVLPAQEDLPLLAHIDREDYASMRVPLSWNKLWVGALKIEVVARVSTYWARP